jgi:hypothetical protein
VRKNKKVPPVREGSSRASADSRYMRGEVPGSHVEVGAGTKACRKCGAKASAEDWHHQGGERCWCGWRCYWKGRHDDARTRATQEQEERAATAAREREEHHFGQNGKQCLILSRQTVWAEGMEMYGELCYCGVRCYVVNDASCRRSKPVCYRLDLGECYKAMGEWGMSKYLKAAAKTAAGKSQSIEVGIDPALFKGRPAIQEFMTLLVDDAGKPRDVSCLMIALRKDGLAVGLKDEGAGWVWRQGKTFGAALDAIEAALQGDEPCFGGERTGGQRGGRKKGG